MSKRFKPARALPTPADLEARVRRALGEGRTQHALELARQLVKAQPSPAREALLRQAYLERARQLREQGHTRDAATVLVSAAQLAGDAAWYEKLAEELAAAGKAAEALRLVEDKLPGSPIRARVLARAADAALAQGPSGRELLPETLRPQFDQVVQAFARAEAGQDDEARAALQEIGLQSPFLEWKLLLRGLLAYYQRDDVRALENWQRLQPERVPARIAAPFRFLIDAAFRTAQPPETQNILQQQVDRLTGSSLVQGLRLIQASLAHEKLAPAFRQAEQLLPALRAEAPQLVPRLASCFYWAVIRAGEEMDVPRYARLFGAPADDPQFARMSALALEERGQMDGAHRQWQRFEQSVAQNPAAWPAGQADRVRALVWAHMGRNAANVPDVDKLLKQLPPFLRDHPDRPQPLDPSAEKCLRRSIELAPDQLEPYEALVDYYLERDKAGKAEKAARQLLARFPEHAPTLEGLGNLLFERGNYAEALDLFGRALKINPLDRELRARIGTTHLFHARTFAEDGRFAEARGEYQASLDASEGPDRANVLCKWAACEFKAGASDRAEELLRQAAEQGGQPLPIAYAMLIEATRLKLARPLKKRFDDGFKAGLAEPPTGASAAELCKIMVAHSLAGVTYYGQKTHEKKILAYVEKAARADLSETQLEAIASGLLKMAVSPQVRKLTQIGQRRFPDNPWFPFLEAETYIAQGPSRCPIWKVAPLLEEARRLASARQHSERERHLLETIQDRQNLVGALNPFAGGLFDPFGGPGFFDDDEPDFYDDEDDW